MQTIFLLLRNIRGVLDGTEIESYFYHNIFDISQSQHRIVRVSKGSNKKSFTFKLFSFCDLKTKQPYILQDEVSICKRELISLIDSLRDFFKLLITLASVYKIPLPSPNLRLELQSQRKTSLLITIRISLNIQIDEIVDRFDLRMANLESFPSKIWTTRQSYCSDIIANLNHREIHYLYLNR